MVEFGEYCFIKWKFKFWNFLSEIRNSVFSIGWSFFSINWNDGEKNPEVSGWFDCYSIPVWSIERNSRLIETQKTEFSAEFSSHYLESLKRFQALWTVLWNILTLHTYLLMKYNPMGISRGLWRETQEILWLFSRIAIYRTQQLGCILRTNLR